MHFFSWIAPCALIACSLALPTTESLSASRASVALSRTSTLAHLTSVISAPPKPTGAPHVNKTKSALDEQCKKINQLTALLAAANKTAPAGPMIPEMHLPNATVIANATAELNTLKSNATLVNLCKQAGEVTKGCMPLMPAGKKGPGHDSPGDKLNHTMVEPSKTNNTAPVVPAPINGTTLMPSAAPPKVNATAIASANSTLVNMCAAYFKMLPNMTQTDAALSALHNLTNAGTGVTAASTTSGQGRVEVLGGLVSVALGLVMLCFLCL